MHERTHKWSTKRCLLALVLVLALTVGVGLAVHTLNIVTLMRAAHGN